MMVSGIGIMMMAGHAVRAELRHHQQVDHDQADAVGNAHVAEGFVGDLPFAVPFHRHFTV
jgi:hypothetical protein